ncbi:MAG TPA: SDR family oxidoreductase [Gaiellaceae bacterium]|nr:SDR family oxidoreductase [Gaiellaceae bacterium]
MIADLQGKLALVTGASGNLGPVWCDALEGAGMRVVRLDVKPGDGVEAADVTDKEALRAIRDRIGAPDVLVNNAGIDQPPDPSVGGGIENVDADEFLRVLDVNTRGVFTVTQVFGAAMAEAGRGSIVNIGSLYASIAPIPALYDHMPGFIKPPAYAASKAGVVALTKYFARLWGPRGVRVNTLSPGGVRGDQDDEFLRKYNTRVPLGRMAEPADLTGPLLFLASDASRYLTGHELRVDGGFTA